MTSTLPGLFAVRKSPGWLFTSFRSAERDQALWLKVGTNVRKWFRLLRVPLFFLCVVYFMKILSVSHRNENRWHSFWLEKQNSWPLHETRVWFPVITATRSTNLWGFRTQQIPPTCVLGYRGFNTTLSIPLFTRGVEDWEMLWADSVLNSTSKKNTGCTTVTDGSWTMSLVLHCPTHRHTKTYIHFSCPFQVAPPPSQLFYWIINPQTPTASPAAKTKFPLNLH